MRNIENFQEQKVFFFIVQSESVVSYWKKQLDFEITFMGKVGDLYLDLLTLETLRFYTVEVNISILLNCIPIINLEYFPSKLI